VQGQSDVKFFLHNHLRFAILYNRDPLTDLSRIVGFEVEPFSVRHEYESPYDKNNPDLKTCNPGRMVHVTHSLPPQSVEEGTEVIFTYDVIFQVSSRSR
jgi:transmembrane 9 superfamily protein 2/4